MTDLEFPDSSPEAFTCGTWTSQLLEHEKGQFASGDSDWGLLYWEEEETSDESQAYIRVDILNSSSTVLVSDITLVEGGVELSEYADIGQQDIYVRFKLYSLTKVPVAKNMTLDFAAGGLT